MRRSLLEIAELYPINSEVDIVNSIYDSIIMYVPEHMLDEVITNCSAIMSQFEKFIPFESCQWAFGWNRHTYDTFKIPAMVDAEVGPSWLELEPYEPAK